MTCSFGAHMVIFLCFIFKIDSKIILTISIIFYLLVNTKLLFILDLVLFLIYVHDIFKARNYNLRFIISSYIIKVKKD